MTTEEYHKHPAVSASILKRILIDDETYEVACGIPIEETDAMRQWEAYWKTWRPSQELNSQKLKQKQ